MRWLAGDNCDGGKANEKRRWKLFSAKSVAAVVEGGQYDDRHEFAGAAYSRGRYAADGCARQSTPSVGPY